MLSSCQLSSTQARTVPTFTCSDVPLHFNVQFHVHVAPESSPLALLGVVAVKVISLAGITRDPETEMLILTMYLKKVFESIKKMKNQILSESI